MPLGALGWDDRRDMLPSPTVIWAYDGPGQIDPDQGVYRPGGAKEAGMSQTMDAAREFLKADKLRFTGGRGRADRVVRR